MGVAPVDRSATVIPVAPFGVYSLMVTGEPPLAVDPDVCTTTRLPGVNCAVAYCINSDSDSEKDKVKTNKGFIRRFFLTMELLIGPCFF